MIVRVLCSFFVPFICCCVKQVLKFNCCLIKIRALLMNFLFCLREQKAEISDTGAGYYIFSNNTKEISSLYLTFSRRSILSAFSSQSRPFLGKIVKWKKSTSKDILITRSKNSEQETRMNHVFGSSVSAPF